MLVIVSEKKPCSFLLPLPFWQGLIWGPFQADFSSDISLHFSKKLILKAEVKLPHFENAGKIFFPCFHFSGAIYFPNLTWNTSQVNLYPGKHFTYQEMSPASRFVSSGQVGVLLWLSWKAEQMWLCETRTYFVHPLPAESWNEVRSMKQGELLQHHLFLAACLATAYL